MSVPTSQRGGAGGFGVLANFGWLASDRLGRIVVNVGVGILVARHLGPADLGTLGFALALTGIIGVVAALGLEDLLVRDGARGGREGASLWRAAWQLRIGAAAIGYALAVGGAVWLRPEAPRVWGIVAIVALSLFLAPAELVEAWLQARANPRPAALARQGALWAAAAWRLGLIAVGASLWAFAVATVIEALAVAAALGLVWRRQRAGGPAGPEVAAWRRRLLAEGWPLLASSALVTITMQVDRLLLARLAGDAAVGIYSVAARLSEVCHVLPVALGAALLPRLTKLRQENPPEYGRQARRWAAGLVGAGAGAATLLMLAGPVVVPVVFGPAYAAAADVLAVHAWSLPFVFLVSLRTRLLVIEAGTRWVLLMSLVTAALNLGANLLLIPRMGGLAAAWATAGAWAGSALVAPWLFAPTRALMLRLIRGAPPVAAA